jgi:hypothetical protein
MGKIRDCWEFAFSSRAVERASGQIGGGKKGGALEK